jgi:hypothetical protein
MTKLRNWLYNWLRTLGLCRDPELRAELAADASDPVMDVEL